MKALSHPYMSVIHSPPLPDACAYQLAINTERQRVQALEAELRKVNGEKTKLLKVMRTPKPKPQYVTPAPCTKLWSCNYAVVHLAAVALVHLVSPPLHGAPPTVLLCLWLVYLMEPTPCRIGRWLGILPRTMCVSVCSHAITLSLSLSSCCVYPGLRRCDPPLALALWAGP